VVAGEGGVGVAHGQDRLGYPRGWLSEPSYSRRVELERADPSASWQLDDWIPDTWETTDTALPE